MHNLGFALAGAWKVLTVGVLFGAGLPLLFALGIRSLAHGAGGDAGPAPRRGGTVLAHTLFTVVALGVLLGLGFIVASGFGKALTFDHLYPTIVDKH